MTFYGNILNLMQNALDMGAFGRSAAKDRLGRIDGVKRLLRGRIGQNLRGFDAVNLLRLKTVL